MRLTLIFSRLLEPSLLRLLSARRPRLLLMLLLLQLLPMRRFSSPRCWWLLRTLLPRLTMLSPRRLLLLKRLLRLLTLRRLLCFLLAMLSIRRPGIRRRLSSSSRILHLSVSWRGSRHGDLRGMRPAGRAREGRAALTPSTSLARRRVDRRSVTPKRRVCRCLRR